MAVMKNDPEKAIPILEGYLAQLRQVTGDTLPVDLQDQVDRGMITKEAAVEFSRTQSREARSTAAADSAKREADDIRQKRDLEIQGRDVVSAIEKWDETWKNSDPDYGMKTQRVKEKIELYIGRNGLPSTPKDAVDIAEEARKAVEKELKVLVPKKQSIDPDPSGSSGKATPVPQSPLEVVRAVVNG